MIYIYDEKLIIISLMFLFDSLWKKNKIKPKTQIKKILEIKITYTRACLVNGNMRCICFIIIYFFPSTFCYSFKIQFFNDVLINIKCLFNVIWYMQFLIFDFCARWWNKSICKKIIISFMLSFFFLILII